MNVTIFVGDIADVEADAICTSTNPRLSLMMGTGAAIRGRGGYEILRACEALIAASGRSTLPAGSAHVTTAGTLPCKCIIHCVASGAAHQSSEAIVGECVRNALAAADAQGCRTVAMPVFATGHARIKFDRAIAAMANALRSTITDVERVSIVVRDEDLTDAVRRLFPGAPIEMSKAEEDVPMNPWAVD